MTLDETVATMRIANDNAWNVKNIFNDFYF